MGIEGSRGHNNNQSVLFVMERAGTAYRHFFQVVKNKSYYF